jgi:hypothetical protein
MPPVLEAVRAASPYNEWGKEGKQAARRYLIGDLRGGGRSEPLGR